MKQEWEVREKHEADVRGLMERLGYLRNGMIRKFNAAEFWPALESAGHTATRLEECACWTGRGA